MGELPDTSTDLPNGRENDSPPGTGEGARTVETVLVVEDTVELADGIRMSLERMNLRVFHATHGHIALDLLREIHPDLVMLDLALPDATGWKLLEVMREQQRGEKCPVILVITAYGDPANRLMGRLQGIHDYLIKPLTPAEIENAVAQVLNLRRT